MAESELLRKIYGEMTQHFDSLEQRLDSLEQRVDSLEQKVDSVQQEVKEVSRQLARNTASLEKMDSLILDEVERVHDIMIQRTEDLKKKIG